MSFIEELKWRGLLHDITPGTEEQLNKELTSAYIGFDPTSDSLHVGSLLPIMLLVHFQKNGHKPIALVGGATGMIGDPSGKSAERNLLTDDILQKNIAGVRAQLQKFLDFSAALNKAELLNNYDWFKGISLLEFIRDIGKHITVNYMLAKDSVKKRLETGLSFTEFTYQLAQGFDFYYLYQNYNCKLQMGGSDQWGNITTGTELIRRKAGGEAYALTCPLVTKADGSKFGKSEGGNIWLDPGKTSPYKFYQFWLNASDEDAKKYIKYFTLLNRQEVELLEKEHDEAPHLRILQKALAKDVTVRVHSESEYQAAIEASEILFGKGTAESLKQLNEETFLSVFEGVPQIYIEEQNFKHLSILDLLSVSSGSEAIFSSKSEARKMIQGGGVSINKEKISSIDMVLDSAMLLNSKYLLVQKGKKNYYVVVVS